MTGKHPYTPSEILDMGRRAEFEGNLDYATQFYSYLIEGLPGTREAAEARIGMERVSQLRDKTSGTGMPPPSPQAPVERASNPRAYEEVPRTGPSSRLSLDTSARPAKPQQAPPSQPVNPRPQQRTEPSLSVPPARPAASAPPRSAPPAQQPATAAPPPRGAPPPPQAHWNPVSVGDNHADAGAPLPRVVRREEDSEDEVEFVPGYRIGRFLAFALVLFGWLAIVGGIGFAGATVAGMVGTQPVAAYGGLPLGALIGLAAIVAGIALVFIGSLAQAAFEAANNTRELLEIERAKAGW